MGLGPSPVITLNRMMTPVKDRMNANPMRPETVTACSLRWNLFGNTFLSQQGGESLCFLWVFEHVCQRV